MKVLVSAASKHGATAELAQRIGKTLSARGLDATVRPVDETPETAPYDAVVLGSGVYAGHWLKPARTFVDANAAALRGKRLWLFSSGPIGDPPKPTEEPADIAEISANLSVEDHRLFNGRLEKARLSFGERAIVWALGAPDGDYRDWEDVEAWANGIADRLLEGA